MTIKCIIVDDEPLAVELLASYVEKIPFISLAGKYSNATDALKGIDEHQPQLLFLDIQMPDINGLEMARMLNKDVRVVFTTAFENYAIEGFRVGAIDYLLKPITYAAFLEACNRALHWFSLLDNAKNGNAEEPTSIFVKSEYKLVQIALDTIRYVEGLKDYVKIHTDDLPHPVLSLMNMKAMEAMLPASRFIRVHRSYIVPKGRIKEVERNHIRIDDTEIPLGESYRPAFQEFVSTK